MIDLNDLYEELRTLPEKISAARVALINGEATTDRDWDDWALVIDEAHGAIDSLPMGLPS